jgi:uracil-DNA glycosylase
MRGRTTALFGAAALAAALASLGHPARPRPRFGHSAEWGIGPYTLLGCYHPSQQNTFTGRLTVRILDEVLWRAQALLRTGNASPPPNPRRPASDEDVGPAS